MCLSADEQQSRSPIRTTSDLISDLILDHSQSLQDLLLSRSGRHVFTPITRLGMTKPF